MRSEDGVTTVIVALSMVMLIGVVAMAVDVGALYAERRELQNGADAAVLALAQECAQYPGSARCTDDETEPLVVEYANENAKDGATTVEDIDLDVGAGEVTVHTLVEEASSGLPRIQHWFTGLFESGKTESVVRASATATWGGIGGGTSLPIAFCEDAWNHWSGGDASLLPSGPPAQIFRTTTSGPHVEPGDCPHNSFPGGFAFLERNDDCMAVSNEGDMAEGIPGNNPNSPGGSPDCDPAEMYAMFKAMIDAGEVVLIPIFDYTAGSGSDGEYHIIGYGGFKFEGYNVNAGPGGSDRVYQLPNPECSAGGASCLKGYFTEFFALDAVPSPGGGDFGATGVFLTG